MKILVIEDEHRIANTIKKGLEQERYAVDVVYQGDEGFDLAVEGNYDLLILDVMLPYMDGISLCKELRKKQIHTPILMLTAKSQLEDKVNGLNAGADDYLTKPFAFDELLARVKALARRPREVIKEKLKVGDLSLDSKTYHIERDGKPITLSHKEFSLLEYMMRNENTILTKEQMMQHVWSYDTDILPNTIEVYIRNLRNKIDRPFPKRTPLIQTARGFGYKICFTLPASN